MKLNALKLIVASLTLTIGNYANALRCPPAELIKSANLISAIENPQQKKDWSLLSQPLFHKDHAWIVSYWSILLTADTGTEALAKGRSLFADSPILIPHPRPYPIPNQQILCQYTPEGRLYVIEALTKR